LFQVFEVFSDFVKFFWQSCEVLLAISMEKSENYKLGLYLWRMFHSAYNFDFSQVCIVDSSIEIWTPSILKHT